MWGEGLDKMLKERKGKGWGALFLVLRWWVFQIGNICINVLKLSLNRMIDINIQLDLWN